MSESSIVDNVDLVVEANHNKTASKTLFDRVKDLTDNQRRRILVTGGAGFVGSHLVDKLMLDGHSVVVVDNFQTGRLKNVEHWLDHPHFKVINHDVINPIDLIVDEIYHLASPASPVHYMADPVKTIQTNTLGTMNMLELAQKAKARIVLASTSEIYGDPEIHPQSETYWGNTNPIGPRSCYDESKRAGESMAFAYNTNRNVSTGVARIFNTYGPRMDPKDGRVVSNFICQAIENVPLTIYGDGTQTRSFQYISDLVNGLLKLMKSSETSPINLGNPNEMSICSLAREIKRQLPNSSSGFNFHKLPIDDPHRRRPNIRKAMELIDWQPVVSLSDGLAATISYFRRELRVVGM